MAGAATVEKALDVLFHLHQAGSAQGLGDIARALGLAKSSCHRLLAALVRREVVEQDEAGRYRPGLALLALGLGAQRREPIVALARDRLEAEAEALGETVFLVAERRGRLRVLDKCEGSGFLRAAPGVGDVVPADVTAAGRLYRAYRSGRVDGSNGSGRTDRTDRAEGVDPAWAGARPSEAEAIALEDAEIRRRGHAVNRDAWIEGLSVLGVPIEQRTADGSASLVAVIALAAASPRFDAIGEARIAERLRAAASLIGERLGTSAPERIRGGANGRAAKGSVDDG